MTPQPKRPPQKKIAVELPKDLNAAYSNLAFITHTPAEIVLDFVQLLPHTKKGKIVSRVVMTPGRAKLFQMALAQNITNFERQFGEIKVPKQTHLADELFKLRDEEDESEKE